jgi:hypothetical protein
VRTIRIFGLRPPVFIGTLFLGREEKSGNGSTGKEAYVTDQRRIDDIGGSVKGRDERADGPQVPQGREATQAA